MAEERKIRIDQKVDDELLMVARVNGLLKHFFTGFCLVTGMKIAEAMDPDEFAESYREYCRTGTLKSLPSSIFETEEVDANDESK